MRAFLLVLVVVSMQIGSLQSALAQPADRASAEALFRAGREAMERGDYATACQRFTESNRLDPAVGAVFNLGACKEKLGRLAEAWQHFREVVDRLPANDPRVAVAKGRVEALEPRLGRVRITLAPDAPEGSVIIKDNITLGAGSLGVPLPMDPGDHRLVLRAPGHEDRVVDVTLKEGQRLDLMLEPGPSAPRGAPSESPSPAATAATEPVEDGGTQAATKDNTLSYVLIGVGAAGLVTSVVAGAFVLSKKNVVEDHCPDKRCDQEGYDAGRAGRVFSTVGTISFAVGAVALGGGIILLATSGGEEVPPTSARSIDGVLANVGGTF